MEVASFPHNDEENLGVSAGCGLLLISWMKVFVVWCRKVMM